VAQIHGVHETVLYAEDVEALVAFYTDVVGLTQIDPPDAHSAAFRLADGNVLLVFDPSRTSTPGRFVPEHGASGQGHVAFRVDDLDAFAHRLRAHSIEIEREITWPLGGRSAYFRDPAGNSVEYVEGEIWS
jgi:catechol 2,3-dioxygenase-like lactoylglutathione lyase family enzyme